MTGRIRIIARVAGFRRAGVAHVGERLWPADAFSAEQIEQLKAEPNLVVRDEPDDGAFMPESTSEASPNGGRSVDGVSAATKPDDAPAAEQAVAGPDTEAQPAATSEGDGEAQPGPVGDASAVAAETAVLLASDETAAAETGEGSAAEPDKAADPDPAAKAAAGEKPATEKPATKKTTTRSRKAKSA